MLSTKSTIQDKKNDSKWEKSQTIESMSENPKHQTK